MMITRSLSRFFYSILIAALLSLLSFAIILSFGSIAPLYAQDQGARQSPPYDPAQVTTPLAPPFAAAGRASYLENCAPCHGEQGLGNGPTAADLPDPATAFADKAAIWELSPAMLFHTTKFGRLEKLMPPWSNRLDDSEIWNTVAFAWSLHTKESETRAGAELYTQSCANCHGESGAGDGPDATGDLPDFTDLRYTTFVSQAEWQAGWQEAHPEIGADWSSAQQEAALEYIRTFSYTPPWQSPLRPGNGVITGTIVFGADSGVQTIDDSVVLLDAYMGFEPVARFTTTLSADNTFIFENLTVDPNLVYLASVVADGLSYSSAMLSLTPERSATSATITIYGATDSPENIRINRAHWIIDSQPGALVLAQIYLIGNQGDRTFIGRMVDGVDTPVTVGIDIPPDAQEITFQNGALGNRFRRVGNIIYDTMPVLPGDSTQQIIVQYAIPFSGSSYDLRQELLYRTDSLSTLVANYPNLRVDAPEMTFDSVQNIQGSEYQIWRQSNFGPGTIEIKLQGLLERDAVDPRMLSGASAGATTQLAQIGPPMEAWVSWVMMALVAAALLGVTGVAIQRGAIASTTTNQELKTLQESLIAEIAKIDDLHALGQIGDTEWLRRRTNLKAQLMDVMRRLEATRQVAQQV
jgi:mono/diheme cytochrome c family protein